MSINKLFLMAILHWVSMYILMYAMVDRIGHIYPNINNFYMAGLMTMPMLIIESRLIRPMHGDKKILDFILVLSTLLLIVFFILIRRQIGVNNRSFLRSMIPHHSGAILMCERANITNQSILELCEQIIENQEEEINSMESILNLE